MNAARLRRLGAVSDGFQSYEAFEVTRGGSIEAVNIGSAVTVRIGERVVFWRGPEGSRFLQLKLTRQGKVLETFHMGAVPKELWEVIHRKKRRARARQSRRPP